MITVNSPALNNGIVFTLTAPSANPIEIVYAYVDITSTTYVPAGGNSASAVGGTFTLFTGPATGQRQVKYLSAYNSDSIANTFTWTLNVSGTMRTIRKVVLQPGEAIVWDGVTWKTYTATGQEKIDTGAVAAADDVVGPGSATDNAVTRFDLATGKLIQNSVAILDDSGNLNLNSGAGTMTGAATALKSATTNVVVSAATAPTSGQVLTASSTTAASWATPTPGGATLNQRIFRNFWLAHSSTGRLLTSGTAYWCYVGQIPSATTVRYIEFQVGTAGAGAQTAELCLASSPLAPNNASQSLTKIAATGSLDSLTTIGVKRNTVDFAQSVAAGTHLWAGLRTAMATTQPTVFGLCFDMAQGCILTTAASGVLTGAGPFTGAVIAASSPGGTADVPDLRVVMDS